MVGAGHRPWYRRPWLVLEGRLELRQAPLGSPRALIGAEHGERFGQLPSDDEG
jgi:hypothetical protein